MISLDALLNINTRKTLDILSVGIIITDCDGMVKYVNPEYLNYSGLKEDDIVGKDLSDVRPGAVLPSVLKNKKQLYNIPRKIDGVESYNDYFPIIIDDEFIGGIVVVKDLVRIKEVLDIIEENKQKISQLDEVVKHAFKARFTFADIVGINDGLGKITGICQRASTADSPVLLIGESGTGKEVFAQAIHNASKRGDMPFVDINCAALPEHLLESELFGYEAGSFTGATGKGKMGLLEIANGGTIFLDEISEMPLTLQTKLLRVIQENMVRRIGGIQNIPLDIKIIAATNRNVSEMIDNKIFREDLYYRLAVFVINIPPLRERREDIVHLTDYFIQQHMRKQKKIITIDQEVLDIFKKYDWKGNTRELKNTIEYAVNMSDDSNISINELPNSLAISKDVHLIPDNINTTLSNIVGEVEKRVLNEYLSKYGNTLRAKKQIASKLGLSMATLYNKIKKYDLS